MKRILISAAAVGLISAPAFAADLGVYEADAPIFAPEPAATSWSGFYIGLHGGYGWAGDLSGVDDDDVFFESSVNGPVLGGQLGMNWQWDWFVLGAEGDASWAGLNVDDDENGVFEEEDVVDFLASGRLRAGVGLGAAMAYATAGFGLAGVNDPFGGDDGGIDAGWTAGAGGDILLTDNISFGVQYLHYGFGDADDHGRNGLDSFDGSVDAVTGRINLQLGP